MHYIDVFASIAASALAAGVLRDQCSPDWFHYLGMICSKAGVWLGCGSDISLFGFTSVILMPARTFFMISKRRLRVKFTFEG